VVKQPAGADAKDGTMHKSLTVLTPEQLARLGGGILGYVREINLADAKALLGEGMSIPPKSRLFALYNADGSPVSISGSREGAIGSAFDHELVPTSVH
jgi:hypothetical protein